MTKIEKLRDHNADIAIVLGSGLSSIVPNDSEKIPYSEFAELPQPSVPGHAGQFALAKIEKKNGTSGSRATWLGEPARVDEPGGESTNVIFAQGRVHLYEGYSAHEVTAHIRILAAAGIKQLILTNAAGSLNPNFKPGSWMMIADQINLTGTSPLLLWRQASSPATSASPNFLDMTDAYSPRLREKFRAAANKIEITLHEGVYAGLLGPQYETPAEVKMLRSLGADAVGMSTVLETIQARALGLEVAGFSCLTNLAAGLSKEKLSHEEVLEVGTKAAGDFIELLQARLSS